MVLISMRVAPHTGAWIETICHYCHWAISNVAPHTGAWIETLYELKAKYDEKSHPTRVRGLKLGS